MAVAAEIAVLLATGLTTANALPQNGSCPSPSVLATPTTNPYKCTNDTKFFSQTLDHATPFKTNGTCNTFPQQFQIVSDYFTPGGSIILYQGAESEMLCAEITSVVEIAKAVGGLAVSVEHRFFGLSVPSRLNYTESQDWQAKDLAPLTLENVLLDSVNFIEWLKATYSGATKSKVFVLGASYGGFLTALLRMRYPDTFAGAIASSSGIRFVTSPTSPRVYNEGNYLNTVYLEQSASASTKIRAAFEALRIRMLSGAFAGLDKDLALCKTPSSTDQYPSLASNILVAFFHAAQYNYPFPKGKAPANPIQNLTTTISNSNSTNPLEPLKLAIQTLNEGNCANFPTTTNTFPIPWQWATCTYYPFQIYPYTTTDTIFGSIPPDFSVENMNGNLCQDVFAIKAASEVGFVERYGLTQSQLEASTGILFTEGLVDPVTPVGPDPFYATSGKADGSKMLFIDGAGHGLDVLASTPDDLGALTNARSAEIEWIRELAQAA